MKYFSVEDILLIHHELIEKYGGSHGVRDINRVDSVVNSIQQAVFGEEQYKTVFEKAAVLMRNIIKDHPFVDGNKRTGAVSAILFLEQNGWLATFKDGEIEDFAVQVATKPLKVIEIADRLQHGTKARK